jgi:hypothetical protein
MQVSTPKQIISYIARIEHKQDTIMEMLEKLLCSTDNNDAWLSVEDLTKYHPAHPKKGTVYLWVYKCSIPHHKLGKNLAFRKSEIDAWIIESAKNKEAA